MAGRFEPNLAAIGKVIFMAEKLNLSQTNDELGNTENVQENVHLQDYLDILWQSAIEYKRAGGQCRFLAFPDNAVGILLSSVVVSDGKPVLN